MLHDWSEDDPLILAAMSAGYNHAITRRCLNPERTERRPAALAGDISADVASLAQGDLVLLRVGLFPYSACASRVWELRSNITAYDACYVALAETLGARGNSRRQTEPRSRDSLRVRCSARVGT